MAPPPLETLKSSLQETLEPLAFASAFFELALIIFQLHHMKRFARVHFRQGEIHELIRIIA